MLWKLLFIIPPSLQSSMSWEIILSYNCLPLGIIADTQPLVPWYPTSYHIPPKKDTFNPSVRFLPQTIFNPRQYINPNCLWFNFMHYHFKFPENPTQPHLLNFPYLFYQLHLQKKKSIGFVTHDFHVDFANSHWYFLNVVISSSNNLQHFSG